MPKIYNNLDFQKLYEIRNALFHRLTTAPLTPTESQTYYDTDDKIPYFYNGTSWIAMSASAGGPPSGSAGGALSGTYPNPDIAANAITNTHMADNAIGTAELAASAVTDAKVSASAAIQLSKLATDPLARANHTGTQTASTISDFNTAVRTNRLDQMAAPTAAVSMGSQLLSSLATPVSATDAANKSYVDSVAANIAFKEPVRVASTSNGTLATAFANGSTVDGQTLATGDRILLAGQTTASENGIYTVNASGAPTRATDADASGEIKPGTLVYVRQGTANGAQQWVCTATGATPWVPGSSTSTWVLYFAVTATQAGAGLTGTANVLAVGVGTGIVVNADNVAIDTSVVSQRVAFNVGDGTSTAIALTHSFGTRDVGVTVYRNSTPWDEIIVDVEHTSTSVVTLQFGAAPSSNEYRAVVRT